MKNLKYIPLIALVTALATILVACNAKKEEAQTTQESQATINAKPYPLDTCLVCGMKLAEMGEPYTFIYEGQQIKVCDKSEKASFDKDPAQYMKKLADAAANKAMPNGN